MKKRVAVCAALGVLAMQGGSAYAGIDDGDYPLSGGGGGVPQCEAGGDGGAGGGTGGAGGDDGCWQAPPAPGNPVQGVSARTPAPQQQELPATGTDTGDVLRIGGVSLAAGLGLLAVTRRRRQSVVS